MYEFEALRQFLPRTYQSEVNKAPRPEIDEVIYNDPATIVKWKDGTKTVVKCHEGDEYDPKLGLLYCIAKKTFGGGRYNDILAKHLPKAKVETKVEFDWEDFKKGNLIVNCRTEDDAKDFLKECRKRDLNWYSGSPADYDTFWNQYKGGTCYRYGWGNLTFGRRGYYEDKFPWVSVVEWIPKTPKTPKGFDWDAFEKGTLVVNCKTYEAANDFMKHCEKHGFNWLTAPATDYNNWGFHGDKTCYRYDGRYLTYCYRRHHEGYGREIFEWEPKEKFDWKGFKNGEFSVECKTLKAAKKFNRKAKKHGIVPFSEDNIERQIMMDETVVYTISRDGDLYGLWVGKGFVADTVKEYK